MAKFGRPLEIAVGLFFILSAALKALDMEAFAVQVKAYDVLPTDGLITSAAYFAVAIETILGALFLLRAGAPRAVYVLSAGMTIVYTGLIAYAWPEDCGCLGALIPMGPVESIAKNVVLLGVMAAAFKWTRQHEATAVTRRAWSAAALAAVVAVGIYATVTKPEATTLPVDTTIVEPDRPFAAFVFKDGGTPYDLGVGEYLVVMLNTTCDHCIASVPALNEIASNKTLPTLVALMMGDDDSLDDFIIENEPEFPTRLIDSMKFMDFIESAPPRLIYNRDGAFVQAWEWEDDAPTAEMIRTEIQPES